MATEAPDAVTMDKIVALCKRRGFLFQSSEIYGGLGSAYDYRHYGVLLQTNVKNEWWRAMIQERDDIVALDSAIILHPKTWEASGHLGGFSDPLVQCLGKCKQRFREDHLRAQQPEGELKCPVCGGELPPPRHFNLMFKTHHGPVEDEGSEVYLRPETAQGIFLNFKNALQTSRKRPPFGIAQVGKSFRNEITPGNFIFRTREFEQMEMEFFVPPADAERWYEYWCKTRFDWYTDLGIPESMLRLRPHDPDELSHYSVGTSDVEFEYPWGWGELEGIANRTDYDLTQHGEFSGEDLSYFDQEHDRRYIPYVIEPAAGADRATLAFLLAAYHEDEAPTASGKVEKRTVLRLDPRLSPYKVAVLPLSKNDKLVPISDRVAADLRTHHMVDVDLSGAIGRRSRRQDEVGTPYCVTID